jgi:hypothetical protein
MVKAREATADARDRYPRLASAAITPPRTVIVFLVDQDFEEFAGTGLIARTWHWVLHGGGPPSLSNSLETQE